MKNNRHSVETIMRILRQAETDQPVAAVCRKCEITEQTLYRWRRKYDNMEGENRRLKSIVADQALNIVVLKEVNSKNGKPGT